MSSLREWLESNQDGRGNLQKNNPLPSDNLVVFEPEKHMYTLQRKVVCDAGEKVVQIIFPSSVTGFVKSFFPPFDEKVISERCANNRGVEVASVLQEWSEAREAGTTMHAYIESVYNGMQVPQKPWELGPEFVQFESFKQFVSEHKGWVPFRTELILYSAKYMVAGSCDMVFLDPKTKLVYICDWKRSKQIWQQSLQGLTGFGPCEDLPDCNRSHYDLQLNAYRFLFEAQVGTKVGGMYLAVFHPGQKDYQFLAVPDYSKKIARCFSIRRLHLIQQCITKLRVGVDQDRKAALQHCLVLDCLRCDVKLSCWRVISNANNAQQRRQAWERLVIPTFLDEDTPLHPLEPWVGIGQHQREVEAATCWNIPDGCRVLGL